MLACQASQAMPAEQVSDTIHYLIRMSIYVHLRGKSTQWGVEGAAVSQHGSP